MTKIREEDEESAESDLSPSVSNSEGRVEVADYTVEMKELENLIELPLLQLQEDSESEEEDDRLKQQLEQAII